LREILHIVDNSYTHLSTNFGRFVLVFQQVATSTNRFRVGILFWISRQCAELSHLYIHCVSEKRKPLDVW